MSVRVISGKAKGKRLKRVPGDTTRPIMDRAKEALFNIIGLDILDTEFLDLFAGTGSVGIEALSRGAHHAHFVDLERRAVQTIRENLKIAGLSDNASVQQADALALLKNAPGTNYDYIYVAPPQYKNLWRDTIQALDENPQWIPEGTTVIVQIDPKEWTDIAPTHLEEYDRRKYGSTLLIFFESIAPETD